MLQVTRLIAAPTERVWDILIDTHLWARWGPSVRKVDSRQRLLTNGFKGRLLTPLGLWLPFEITRFEPPFFWAWAVAGIPATGHRLQPIDPNCCELIFEIPYRAFFYRPICRRASENIARLALSAAANPADQSESAADASGTGCSGVSP